MSKLLLSVTNDFISVSIDTNKNISDKEDVQIFAKDLFLVIEKLNQIDVNGIKVSASLCRGSLDDLLSEI